MKILLSVAAVVAFSVAPALAGEGHVSHRSLANMGLSGMSVMSDAQGMHVRGLSIAVAGGGSIASINGVGGSAGSINFYFAAGKHSASGDNLSGAADYTSTTNNAGKTTTTVNIIAAGGFSSAKAGK